MCLWQMNFCLSLIASGLFVISEGIAVSKDSQFDVVAKKKFFIDRSLLVERLFPYKSNCAILAPSKFGKTTNLSMMRQFFEMCVDKNGNVQTPTTSLHYSLFKKLKIGQRPFFEEHFARHPVIYLDLSEFVVTGTALEFKESFLKVVRRLLTEHEYLMQSKVLDNDSKKKLKDSVDRIESDSMVGFTGCYFAKKLSKRIRKHFNQSIFVFIDGIDAPAVSIIESNNTRAQIGYTRDVADFVTNLIERNSENILGVLSTGVTVHGLDIFDDQRITVHHALDSHVRDFYGLTDDEVSRLLSVAGIAQSQEQLKDLRAMYAGYRFIHPLVHDDREMYNTQSIIKFCEEKIIKPYWDAARTLQPVKKLLLPWNFGATLERSFYKDIVIPWSLVSSHGISLIMKVNEFLAGNSSHDGPANWSTGQYLYENGFFTIHPSQDRANPPKYRKDAAVTVPNNEIRQLLLDLVLNKDYYKLKYNVIENHVENFIQSVVHLNASEVTFKHMADCVLHLFGNKENIAEQSSFKFPLYSYLREAGQDIFKEVFIELKPEAELKTDLVVTRKDGKRIFWGLTLGKESGLVALKKVLEDEQFKAFPGSDLIILGVNILNAGERCDLSYLYESIDIKDVVNLTGS